MKKEEKHRLPQFIRKPTYEVSDLNGEYLVISIFRWDDMTSICLPKASTRFAPGDRVIVQRLDEVQTMPNGVSLRSVFLVTDPFTGHSERH